MMQENQEMETLHKELRRTRICCTITSSLVFLLLVGGFLVFGKVRSYAEQLMPLVQQVSALEFDTLNDTLESLNKTWGEMDWEAFSAQMAQLDIDALNEAIAGLDTAELSQTLEKLNDITESLEKFASSIKDFISKVGGNSWLGSL